MVDRPGQWTNRPKYPYSFKFLIKSYSHNRTDIMKMYLNDEMSASQIAESLNVSKTFVLERLREQNIRNGAGIHRASNPNNYRLPHPAYGWKVLNSKLVPNKAELKVARLIVKLIRENVTFNEVSNELVKRKYKNRKNSLNWSYATLKNIYKRWNDKL